VRIGRRPRVLFAHLNQQKRYGGDRSRDHEVFVIISILVNPRASQFRHVCSTCAFLISSCLYDTADVDSLPDVHWCKAFLCFYSCWSHGRLRMPHKSLNLPRPLLRQLLHHINTKLNLHTLAQLCNLHSHLQYHNNLPLLLIHLTPCRPIINLNLNRSTLHLFYRA
jgi:hypothetical protein